MDWMPPPSRPAYEKFRELELNFLGSMYAEQKELLDAAYQRGGIDLFVANFLAVAKTDGSVVSS